jgi:hypothetical protein
LRSYAGAFSFKAGHNGRRPSLLQPINVFDIHHYNIDML